MRHSPTEDVSHHPEAGAHHGETIPVPDTKVNNQNKSGASTQKK
jgi:hypothetical protein